MKAESGRQSRRIAQRRNAETPALESETTRYASENFSADEMRQARLIMIVSGLAFLGGCVAYVVAAGGQIFG
jgi:hypothetical protein